MVFSSLLFIFAFLPVVLLLYYGAPRRMRNFILFSVSLFFYAWGEPIYIVLMIGSTLADYAFGLALSRETASHRKRQWLVVGSVMMNLAVLSFFKYVDFLIETMNVLLRTDVALLHLPLPIGISFYTFQSLSYVIDVYRKEVEAERHWIDFGAYVSLFPQLVAGPIVQYKTIAHHLHHRQETVAQFAEGVRRFIIGLSQKVLLANNIGMLWQSISTSPLDTLPLLTAWIGIVAFGLHIYFDFSGYSHMAIGLGYMFGFRFPENFNYPYVARNVTDFWRRWHISLGSWFRTYVYIPLGGNRVGRFKQLRNIFIVWLLTGLWHGASWNYVLWGLYFGGWLMFEKLIGLRYIQKAPRFMQHMYTLVILAFGWVLFAFESLPEGLIYAKQMVYNATLWDETTFYYIVTEGSIFIVGIFLATPLLQWKRWTFRTYVFSVVLFILCIAYLVDASFNPFLYFRF